MNFVDVFGPPGVGKSTLCYPVWGDREVTWDGLLPPASWAPFIDATTNLMRLVRSHPTFTAVVRMNNRSFRKMATVTRMKPDPNRPAFIQTGLIQRGLGFGWRLQQMGCDVNLIRPFFERMPVSIGAVHLTADPEIIKARNNARRLVAATAHEDRAFMVDLMAPAITIAMEVLRGRGVPVLEIDTAQDVATARRQLLVFATQEPFERTPHGPSGEVPLLSSPPVWWQ